MKKKKDLLEKVLIAITWLLCAVAIYWTFLKLTNHSPTVDQLTFVMVGIFGVITVAQQYQIGKLEGRMIEFGRRLDRLEDKVDKIQEDISFIKSDLSFIKSRLS